MNTRAKWAGGVLLLVVALLIGFSVRNARREEVPQVMTTLVQQGDIRAVLRASGVVRSENEQSFMSSNLLISRVHVAVGDRVSAGDLLLEFDTRDLENAVRQTEIQLENAKLQKAQAAEAEQSARNLRSELLQQEKHYGALLSESRGRLDAAMKDPFTPENLSIIATETQRVAGYESALSGISQGLMQIPATGGAQTALLANTVELATLAYETAKNRLEAAQGSIFAPFGGVVTAMNAMENSIVSLGSPILTLKDDQNLFIQLALSKFDAAKVSLDQEAEVRYGDDVFRGRVSFISPAATPPGGGGSALPGLGAVTGGAGESTLGVRVKVFEPRNMILDFDADVEILLEQKRGVVTVPIEAVIYRGAGPVVYVVEEDVVREQPIAIGVVAETQVEVLEGLSEGVRVVLNPSDALEDGRRVTYHDRDS